MLRSTPRVSILLPVRNAEETLEEALDSIHAQTLTDWEVVAVDDGSTDRSLEVLERCAGEDPRIRILARPQGGIVEALEAARGAARAPLLARMDADDRAVPDRLRLQAGLLEERADVALCGTHIRYFPRERVRAGGRRYERWLNSLRGAEEIARDLWIECPIAHPTFMMRADAVEAVGGYRDRGWPEDYDLLLRLWAAGGRIDLVPRVLLHWREGPRRLSRRDPRYAPDAFRRAKLHFLRKTLLVGRSGVAVFGAGPIGKAIARGAVEAGIALLGFVDLDPRKIGREIHGAPVLPLSEVDRFRGALSLAAVGQPGAREGIRRALRSKGWREGIDFVAVA